jgi:hypothetical protein
MSLSVRIRVVFVFLFFLFASSAGYGQIFQWAKPIDLTAMSVISNITTDRNNNLFIVDYGSNTLVERQTAILQGSGIVIVKFNSSGKLLWQSLLNTNSAAQPLKCVRTDRFGSLYFLILTTFHFGVDLGQLHIPAQDSINETVLVKADSNGNPLWYRICEEHLPSNLYTDDSYTREFHSDLAIDSSDHIYVGTDYASDLSIQGTHSLHSQHTYSTAIEEFDLNGNPGWRKNVFDASAMPASYYNGMKHFLLTGLNSGCVIGENIIDSSVVNNVLRVRNEGSVIYSRYSAAGDLLWNVEPVRGPNQLGGIGADSAENIYFRLYAQNQISWDSATINAEWGYVILGKCSSSGSVQHVRRTIRDGSTGLPWYGAWYGSNRPDLNFSVDRTGNNYVSGSYSDSLVIDDFRFASPGTTKSYFAKYAADGSLRWVQHCHGRPACIQTDNHSGLFALGPYSGTMYIGESKLSLSYGKSYLLHLAALEGLEKKLPRKDYCAGDTMMFRFQESTQFDTSNRFSVELSAADGRFPGTIIGVSGSSTDALPILCRIPRTTNYSEGYRLRLNISSADADGAQYTEQLTIHPLPTVKIVARKPTSFCDGNSIDLGALGAKYYRWSTGDTSTSITVSDPGLVTLAGIDSEGCGGRDSIMIVVKPLPKVSIKADGPITFCDGGSVRLSATGAISYYWSSNATTNSITVTKSGVYQASGSGYDSCIGKSNTILVTVLPSPAVPTITHNGFLLTSSADSNNQWLYWGKPIAGATSKTYTATQPGEYSVIVTNSNGCSTGSAIITMRSDGVSSPAAKNLAAHVSLNVFPNPMYSSASIEYELPADGRASMTITDILGNTVAQPFDNVQSAGLHQYILAMSQLPTSPGVYFIRLQVGHEVATTRLITF